LSSELFILAFTDSIVSGVHCQVTSHAGVPAAAAAAAGAAGN